MDDAQWNYLHQRRFDVRLRVRMNRLYQQARQRTMEFREGIVKASSLVAGSVALTYLAEPAVIKAASAVIFAGTASSLVFGWGTKARDAARRASDWSALERDIDRKGERTFAEADLDEWTARCSEIEATEPAPNGKMIEQAYLGACQSLGAAPTPSGAPWWKRFMPALIVP